MQPHPPGKVVLGVGKARRTKKGKRTDDFGGAALCLVPGLAHCNSICYLKPILQKGIRAK